MSDEACDKSIGHVLGSVLRYLVLLDEEYGVGAGVLAWHPLGKWHNSFPYECIHVDLVLWFETRWRYSKSSTLSPITEFAILQNHDIGILRADIS